MEWQGHHYHGVLQPQPKRWPLVTFRRKAVVCLSLVFSCACACQWIQAAPYGGGIVGDAHVEDGRGDSLARSYAIGDALGQNGGGVCMREKEQEEDWCKGGALEETSDACGALGRASCTPGGAHVLPGGSPGVIQASFSRSQ
ncbi:unnamed protein product [Ilex paraguariensis]|uniref:Uncharacterized protein n=1 Tax=Ilex paraguariensis TaxID=185542 RepID=A0ABC8R7N3_9AQUA